MVLLLNFVFGFGLFVYIFFYTCMSFIDSQRALVKWSVGLDLVDMICFVLRWTLGSSKMNCWSRKCEPSETESENSLNCDLHLTMLKPISRAKLWRVDERHLLRARSPYWHRIDRKQFHDENQTQKHKFLLTNYIDSLWHTNTLHSYKYLHNKPEMLRC